MKALADLFEMHMGALAEENREREVETWCTTVGARLLEAVYESVVELARQNIQAASLGEFQLKLRISRR